MQTIYGGMIFILGLILGSFFNVCIFRIPREESISFPPSHCSNCKDEIKKYDLIPIISYMFLKGKCRSCNEKISLQYPLVELITGILFTIIYLNFGFSVEFFLYIILTSVLIITAVIDINTEYIYEGISIIGILSGAVFIMYSYALGGEVLTFILGGLVAGAVIGIFALLGGMGWGDVEVAFMCGLFLGVSSSILMIFISIITAGMVGVIILIKNKKLRKDNATMPFAPYIAIGWFVSLICGEGIIKAFLSYYGLY